MTFTCSRLRHQIRIDTTGEIYPCCIMKNNPKFSSIEEMLEGDWYSEILDQEEQGIWPKECFQCLDQENHGQKSPKIISNERDKIFKRINPEYRIIDISVDNVCNAACQTCTAGNSSYYAKIIGRKKLIQKGGRSQIERCLNDNVIEIELSGGEPLYSKSHDRLFQDLPRNIRWLRINTNGSVYYDFTHILEKGIIVELTVSFDGIGKSFEYVRWPLKWDQCDRNFDRWLELRDRFPQRFKLSIVYTVSALNIACIDEMRKWTADKKVGLSYNYLINYDVLNIRYRNRLTKRAINVEYDFPIACDRDNDIELGKWLEMNDRLRKIDYRDYLGDNNG